MINKINSVIGTLAAIIFFAGITVTLNKSNMITFWDVLPVYVIMLATFCMMGIEVYECLTEDTKKKKKIVPYGFD